MSSRGRSPSGDTPDPGPERGQLRQILIGLLALPLSAVPFAAYGTFTAEGRLVRDRLAVALSPPQLPELTAPQRQAAEEAAPHYEGKVMVLAYHGVGTHSGSDGEGGFVVSPGRFGEHLATLRAAGMHTVTAAEVAAAFGGGAPLPGNAVMITFDDGRNDALTWADPLLEQAGMKATMFVISGAASDPGIYYAGWGRLRTAARSGRWDVEAHTHASHRDQKVSDGRKLPVLTSLTAGESISAYRRRIGDDLEKNSAAIAAHIGRRPVAFAYPFGAYGAERTNDPRIRQVLAEEVAGRFVVAFHQDQQDSIPLAHASQDRLGLRRLEVGNWTGQGLLERITRAAAMSGGRASDPSAVPPPVTGHVPPTPISPVPRQEPARTPPETTMAPPETTVGPPPQPPPVPATATPTPAPPAPPMTTDTTTGPTTTTVPPATTTTTGLPTSATTELPATTTTTACAGVHGKPCNK